MWKSQGSRDGEERDEHTHDPYDNSIGGLNDCAYGM